VKRGHQATVIHDVDAYQWLAGKHLPQAPVMQEGVEVIGLRSSIGVLSSVLTHQLGRPVVHGAAIDRAIRDRDTDVVIFNNVSLVGGPGLLSLGGDAARLYIAHEHWLVCPTHVLWKLNREPCDEPTCARCLVAYRRPPQLWRMAGALERNTSNVDIFLARSEFSRRKHAEFGFKREMQVLPLFVPDNDEAPAGAAANASSQHGRPYFLYVGRLARIKGVESLLPAFARHPSADLLVIGDGEEEANLRRAAASLANVKFLGRVPNDRLARYYSNAIAVLAPSLGYETFGAVLIEAFRNRAPVIARRIGPFPEIVEQSGGGLLFSTEDELVAALEELQCNHSRRQSLAEAGYQATLSLWSEDVVVNRLLGFARDAIASRRGKRT
jgi:glycosyltransferase involved in cell wall biosynthesis